MKYLTLAAFLGSVDATIRDSRYVTASEPGSDDRCSNSYDLRAGDRERDECPEDETCGFWLHNGDKSDSSGNRICVRRTHCDTVGKLVNEKNQDRPEN